MFESSQPRPRPVWATCLGVLAAAVALCTGALGAWFSSDIGALARGEVDLWGEPRYEPTIAVDRSVFAGIDFQAVHADLLPAWVIAAGSRDLAALDATADAVRAALAPDPNLVAVF